MTSVFDFLEPHVSPLGIDANDQALFELDNREPSAGPHVLLPNMAYGCGGSILTKQGGFIVGAAGDFDRVGCPDCRSIGQDALLAEQAAQQGRQADVA